MFGDGGFTPREWESKAGTPPKKKARHFFGQIRKRSVSSPVKTGLIIKPVPCGVWLGLRAII